MRLTFVGGQEDTEAARQYLDWPHAPFEIPKDILSAWREAGRRSVPEYEAWQARVAAMDPDKRRAFDEALVLDLRDLAFLDTSGLQIVVEISRRARTEDFELTLVRGERGVQRVEAVRTFHNAEPVRYRVVSRSWVREPRPRRVLVGRQPYSVPGADGLNWGALAGCESGGNPRAVNPAGYYGLYQFDVGTWRSVGGSGMPHHASAGEQTFRAKLLYKSRGRSPWPHCGGLL